MARWRGVPLSTLLRHAGLRADAVQVMAVGLDASYVEDGADWGRVRRPLPLAKALDDVLVAWEMNGEPLPREHGYPVRLVVPGWVGVASIKWLGELRVSTTRVDSPWNTRWYRMHGAGWSGEDAELGRMPVKSVVDVTGAPVVDELVVLRGRAWAGEASIRMVEVSTDGGRTWDEASLTGPNEPSAWVEWEHPWIPSEAGPHTLVTRATDSLGRVQPDTAPDNDDGYLFWAAVRREVSVATPKSQQHGEHSGWNAGVGRPRSAEGVQHPLDRRRAHRDEHVLGGGPPAHESWMVTFVVRGPSARYADV